jgi:thiol-disulfide isomerase/thioredoxin
MSLTLFTYSSLASYEFKANELLSHKPYDYQAHKLKDSYKGSVVVFLSAKCPCSNSHIQELIQLSQKYKDIQFIGIHSNRNEEATLSETYFKALKIPFTLIQDDKAQIADLFKAFKTPHSYLLNAQGEILYQGGVSDSHELDKAKHLYLRDAIDAYLNHQPINTKEARTLGCMISRKGP